MSMKFYSTLLLLSFFTMAISCQNAGGAYSPTVRVATALVSEYSANVETFAGSVDINYEDSSEATIAIGVKNEDVLGELIFSSLSADGDEITRIAGGGRFYAGKDGNGMWPFFSVYSVSDSIESAGISFGSQLGISLGGGLEMPIGDNAFVDVSFSYLISLLDAESYQPSLGATTYTSIEGMSLYLGAGYSF